MSFDLASLFNRQDRTQRNGAVPERTMATGARIVGNGEQPVAKQLNLSVGSTITGQVLTDSGDMLQLEISPGMVLHARVEEGLTFQKGMIMSFAVSSLSDNQIALRALFQNTAAHMDTITKALEAAGLEATADTTSMVNAMMENGMPIDKTALQGMYRQLEAHPAVAVDTIVVMNRLQIPVTENNIRQLEAYLNLEHQISSEVGQIADAMTENVIKLLSEGKPEQGAALIKQTMTVLELPYEEEMKPELSSPDGVVLLKGESGENMYMQQATDEAASDLAHVYAGSEELMNAVQITGGEEKHGQRQRSSPLMELTGLGISGEQLSQLEKGELTGKQLLVFAGELMEKLGSNPQALNENGKKCMEKVIRSKAFRQSLESEISYKWLMTLEDVADKHKVTEYYTRLSRQTGRLAQTLENIPGADKTLVSQVSNIHNNIEFMDQLNQTLSYVQLPLKLAGNSAHGDLYVYTNKRGLSRDDGNISAFLHLDMEHLGPVDVYVALQNQKVSTQFYLQDEEMLNFINDHIHLLDERLQQKGYQMNVRLSVSEKIGNVMEKIIEDQRENIPIGEYSFDMRA